MIKFFILVSSILYFVSASVGTSACTGLTVGTNCLTDGAGYCKESGSCVSLPCYKVNEVAACRSGGALFATSTCKEIGSFSLQYDNVCMPWADTKIDYGYVRFPISTDGTPTNTLTGVTTTALASSASVANLYQLYTFNMQTATNTELLAILDVYIAFSTYLISDAHPYYMEKAMFQSLQNLRDDDTITKPSGISATLTKVWGGSSALFGGIADIYFKRLRTFSKHYQTNYYFINFAQTTLSRLYLTLNGQLHTTTVSWYSYDFNGYIQAISYPISQFNAGLATAKSDVIMIKFIKTDGSGSVSIIPTFTFITTDTTMTAPTTLYQIPLANMANLGSSAATAVAGTFTADWANYKCTFVATGTITSGIFYFG